MGRIYYKELPLFHLYDSDLTGTQKLLMTLLLVARYDIYDLSCLARMRPEDVAADLAELKGVSARQVKTGKKFARKRNHFTKTRCSEQRTGITKKCAYARFYEMPHGFVKSIPLTYEEGIDRRVSSGFEQNRFLHQTAKWMRWRAYPLRCFHHKNLGGFYEHQK